MTNEAPFLNSVITLLKSYENLKYKINPVQLEIAIDSKDEELVNEIAEKIDQLAEFYGV